MSSAMVVSEAGMPGAPLEEETFPGTPARAGMRPVSKPAREAEQMAEGEYMFVKRMPVSARWSIDGVCRSLEP